jgi:nucleoside-diphosphate-sugar epimerase
MKTLLIVGGTGIIGTATAKKALEKGWNVTVTGIENNSIPNTEFVHKDDNTILNRNWDVVFQVYTEEKPQITYQKYKGKTDHMIIMSSTLVYDRSILSFKPIHSNHTLATPNTQGGYVNNKLEIERFWHQIEDINWTILRPHHILGKNSYLGCTPPHNRDPNLIEHIKKGNIYLCDRGRIPLNIVNPKDIGNVVLKLAGKAFGKTLNVVNPKEIIARDYYLKIAEILGIDLTIQNLPGEEVWKSESWKLTTLPHLYDISDLHQECSYIPSTSLETCIRESLANQPKSIHKNKTKVYVRMHTLPEPNTPIYFK